jgi:hypothetical protein
MRKEPTCTPSARSKDASWYCPSMFITLVSAAELILLASCRSVTPSALWRKSLTWP